jgi:hypothetical protein
MGLRTTINNKCFGGRDFYACIKGKLLVTTPTAATCGNDRVGDISYDATGSAAFICTVAGTTWVKLHA